MVGKTCLWIRFYTKEYRKYNIPDVFDNITIEYDLNGYTIDVDIWDYKNLDPFNTPKPYGRQYINKDAILLCFDIFNKKSFENIKTKWLDEVRYYCPNTPLILIGNKYDIINNETEYLERLSQTFKPLTINEIKIKVQNTKNALIRGYLLQYGIILLKCVNNIISNYIDIDTVMNKYRMNKDIILQYCNKYNIMSYFEVSSLTGYNVINAIKYSIQCGIKFQKNQHLSHINHRIFMMKRQHNQLNKHLNNNYTIKDKNNNQECCQIL